MTRNESGYMGNLQYQQAGERDCANAAIDENYQNYLIDYLLDGGSFLENYPDLCLDPVGYNQAIAYMYQPGDFTGEREDIDYNKVPRGARTTVPAATTPRPGRLKAAPRWTRRRWPPSRWRIRSAGA